jgi:hypothetical protein
MPACNRLYLGPPGAIQNQNKTSTTPPLSQERITESNYHTYREAHLTGTYFSTNQTWQVWKLRFMSEMQTRSRSESHHHDGAPPLKEHHKTMQTQARENIGSALSSYNNSNAENVEQHASMMQYEEQYHEQEHPSLLTIQIPTGSRIQPQPTSNTANDDRNRSSTFGSDFDLSWAKERGMSLSCLLTPMGEIDDVHLSPRDAGGKLGNEEGTNATVSTSSTSSAVPMPQSVAMHSMPVLSEHNERAASLESASMFLNDHSRQQMDPPQQKMRNSAPFSHTPPSNVATSYEQSHFQKRMRAGVSILRFSLV